MRDLFYTLLVIWIIWRIIDAINTSRARSANHHTSHPHNKVGETTISYTPPEASKRKSPDDGEYVDYEEVK